MASTLKLMVLRLSLAPLELRTFLSNMGTNPPASVANVVLVDDMAVRLPKAITTNMTNIRKTTMIMNLPVAASRLRYTGPGAPYTRI